MGLNCLWSLHKRHCALIQQVRAEIKYMCTITPSVSVPLKLTAVLIICSSDNGKQSTIRGYISGLKHFIFLFPKILNHLQVISPVKVSQTENDEPQPCHGAGVRMLSFPLSQYCRFTQAGVGWPPQP